MRCSRIASPCGKDVLGGQSASRSALAAKGIAVLRFDFTGPSVPAKAISANSTFFVETSPTWCGPGRPSARKLVGRLPLLIGHSPRRRRDPRRPPRPKFPDAKGRRHHRPPPSDPRPCHPGLFQGSHRGHPQARQGRSSSLAGRPFQINKREFLDDKSPSTA